jgi:hypothetical protein
VTKGEFAAAAPGMGWAERYGLDDLTEPAGIRAVLAGTPHAAPTPSPRTQRKHPVSPW